MSSAGFPRTHEDALKIVAPAFGCDGIDAIAVSLHHELRGDDADGASSDEVLIARWGVHRKEQRWVLTELRHLGRVRCHLDRSKMEPALRYLLASYRRAGHSLIRLNYSDGMVGFTHLFETPFINDEPLLI